MALVSNDRNPNISLYLREISEYPLLTKRQELAIANRIHEADRDGRNDTECHDLVRSNLGFVVKVAREYRNLGLPLEDLIGEGNIGLIDAARHFDPDRGTRFITYAVWWIRRSILKALSQQSSMVRVPASKMKTVRAVSASGRRLNQKLGRKADREEIGRELHLNPAKVDEILQFRMRQVSLDDMVGREKEGPISGRLVDPQSIDPEDRLIKREVRQIARVALRQLNDRDLTVIVNRFGLAGGKAFTLREIGGKMNISRERVRQIEAEARTRLRRVIARLGRIYSPPRDIHDGLTRALAPRHGRRVRVSPVDRGGMASRRPGRKCSPSGAGSPAGIAPGR